MTRASLTSHICVWQRLLIYRFISSGFNRSDLSLSAEDTHTHRYIILYVNYYVCVIYIYHGTLLIMYTSVHLSSRWIIFYEHNYIYVFELFCISCPHIIIVRTAAYFSQCFNLEAFCDHKELTTWKRIIFNYLQYLRLHAYNHIFKLTTVIK